MNITYIVGNGLDLQYELKTRYQNFYEYQNKIYTNKKKNEGYSNLIYESLFSDKVNNYENWSDFELSIGQLTINNDITFYSEDKRNKFISDFSDVVDDLRNYLKQEQDKIDYTKYKIDFETTLNNIRKELPAVNQSAIDKKYNDNPLQHDTVNILTLNYTNVIDRLYELSEIQFRNKLRNNNFFFNINAPIHAHGTIDICTVLGVSDETQIAKNFTEEDKEALIKTLTLKSFRENMHINNSNIIQNSDIIILYGVSLGKTDKYLWEQIAERSVNSSVPIIIYHYVPDFDAGNPLRVRSIYKKVEDKFIDSIDIESQLKKKMRENVIIVIGKTIFDLIER